MSEQAKQRAKAEAMNAIRELNTHSGTGNTYEDQIAIIAKVFDAGAEYAAWVPVSERLPETEGWFLVTTEAEVGTAFKFKAGGWGAVPGTKVIAWMPLPEPYVEQEAKDEVR